MEEFDAPQEHGVKQLRETVERKDEQLKKLEAELASFKDKELNNVFGKLGLQTDNGFGKALKQVYNGPVDIESISKFAKDEYGYEATTQVQEEAQSVPEPVIQDDARSRVAALDANSVPDVPAGVDEQLAYILKNGSVKDSLAAKLGLIENQKNNK
jgi:hypothetical protein